MGDSRMSATTLGAAEGVEGKNWADSQAAARVTVGEVCAAVGVLAAGVEACGGRGVSRRKM